MVSVWPKSEKDEGSGRDSNVDPYSDEAAVMVLLGGGEAVRKPEATSPTAAEPHRAARHRVDTTRLASSVGAPVPEDLEYARKFLGTLPEEIRTSLRQPHRAVALIGAMLLEEDDDEVRQAQFELIRRHLGGERGLQMVRTLREWLDGMAGVSLLPLVDLAIPALRHLTPEQYRSFCAGVDGLVRADRKLSLSEFVIQRILDRHLAGTFKPVSPVRIRFNSLKPLRDPVSRLLSATARVGSGDPDEQLRAYQVAVDVLNPPETFPALRPRADVGLVALGKALDDVLASAPAIKHRVIRALAACVAADGEITIREHDLLRGIADALDCPMPPLLPGECEATV